MISGGILFLVAAVIATHPANNPEARLITVEEASGMGIRSITPEKVRLYWDSQGNLTKVPPEAEKTYVLPESRTPGISYGGVISREEFGFTTGVIPSPDGKKLAVYRKDDSAVSTFPLFDITTRTGSAVGIKYPMAGMDSEKLGICICDLSGNILSELKVTDFDEERYLTNISWSPDGKYIFVQVLDRPQHNMHLNMYRVSSGAFVRTILTESNNAWVEPVDPLHFLKNSYYFIYRTDNRDSFRNLYLCDTLGHVDRITPCAADVSYVSNNGQYIYYTSAEISPVENQLFRVKISGKRIGRPERITQEEGWHTIDMSPDCSKFIDRYSSMNVPGVTRVKSADGLVINKILEALDPIDEYAQCKMELGTVRSADGRFDNYYRLYYPRNFDPSKKYPLIVYVYGGPKLQLVTDSWLGGIRMWEMMMAQKGYVVYVQDNRGTANRGAAFEKSINRNCGRAEMEDQMQGLNTLLARSPWIDRSRIGIYGWSYGGFMTLSLATHYPNTFKVAVAGGPVIDWKWYEVMYGERYMDNPQSNAEGFTNTSLIAKAKDLKARTLICQGMIDETVVPEHSLSFIQTCIDNGVQVDYFLYPRDRHNMAGKARVHLNQKITDYFDTYL